MRFVKAEALGNDFLLVAEQDVVPGKDPRTLARATCDRLRGIGADGLIVFGARPGPRHTMKLWNADGTEAEISGNGLRCLGAYLLYSGHARSERVEIDTAAGPRSVEVIRRSGCRFVLSSNLGSPRLDSEEIPFEIDPPSRPVVGVPLDVEGRTFSVTALSMGNPHCVVLVDRLTRDLVQTYGPRIETHPRFPRKANVEFVEVETATRLAIGIWERGVGETAASGTGAAAAAVAARLNDRVEERVMVVCRGGVLEVDWRDGQDVHVTGEAVVVAEGTYLREV